PVKCTVNTSTPSAAVNAADAAAVTAASSANTSAWSAEPLNAEPNSADDVYSADCIVPSASLSRSNTSGKASKLAFSKLLFNTPCLLLDTPVNKLAQFAPGSTVLSSLTDTQEWMAVLNRLLTVGGAISWTDCPRTPSTITSSTFGSPYCTSTVSL